MPGPGVLFLRSLIFHILFYISNAFQMIFWTPAYFLIPRPLAWRIVRLWGRSHLWLQQLCIGSTYEFRGLENIPKDRPFIVASKHQSAWETYTVLLFLDDPTYILKRELIYVPLFGWYMAKMNVVPVDRGTRSKALKSMTVGSRKQYHDGRKIIIYPEGTRTRPGADPKYKYGITHLYKELDATILPVALNSGLFWPRNSFMLYPGKIVMEFLPPIEPGMEPEVFSAELENKIESATDKLIEEAASSPNPPPLARQIKAGTKSA